MTGIKNCQKTPSADTAEHYYFRSFLVVLLRQFKSFSVERKYFGFNFLFPMINTLVTFAKYLIIKCLIRHELGELIFVKH